MRIERIEESVKRQWLVSLVIGLTFLVFLFWQAPVVPLLAFAAVLLAVVQRGVAGFLSDHTGLGLKWSLLIVLLVAAAVLVGLGIVLVPRVIEQGEELSRTFPDLFSRMADYFREREWAQWIVNLAERGTSLETSARVLGELRGVFSSTFGATTYLVLTVITSIYLAAELDRYRRGILLLFPRHRRERMGQLMDALARTLRYWMLGQMVSMIFLAVFAYVGLRVLGIPLALMLGLLTGALTFIPNLGAIISVVGAFFLALSRGVVRALLVLALYIVLQSMEGYVVTPLVQRRAVALPPALLLLAQVLMALLFGFLGLLLAAPLTAVGLVMVKMLYIEDVIGEEVDVPI